jgi:alanine dehydrogenase
MSETGDLVGFPRESNPADRRTLLTPAVAAALRQVGVGVLAERGIGAGVRCSDQALLDAGVRLASPADVWACPLVLRYRSGTASDLRKLSPGQSIGALFHAEGDPELLTALVETRVTAFSFEFIVDGGRHALAGPGGQIAGVQAVLAGAQALQTPHGRGVLLGGIECADPGRVVVIGSGTVGSAAARTAAALGAQVTVLAHTAASAQRYRTDAPGGVVTAVNAPEARTAALAAADLVIGAILISTYDTPPMITRDDLRGMQPGAVIVDATCGYGSGYLPTAGPIQQPGDPPRLVDGILHVKLDALPALVPLTATAAYTTAAGPYLARLACHVLRGTPDPAIESGCVARGGSLVHPVLHAHAVFYGQPT